MTPSEKDTAAALESVEQQLQEVAFHRDDATACEIRIANATLVLLSVVRLALTATERRSDDVHKA